MRYLVLGYGSCLRDARDIQEFFYVRFCFACILLVQILVRNLPLFCVYCCWPCICIG